MDRGPQLLAGCLLLLCETVAQTSDFHNLSPSSLPSECVCSHVNMCMCVQVHVYLCTYLCGDQRTNSGIILQGAIHLYFFFFWDGVFDSLRTSKQAKPITNRALGTLHLPYVGVTDEPLCLPIFSWVLGRGLRWRRHFSDWEITAAPAFLSIRSKDDDSLNRANNDERWSAVSWSHGNNCVVQPLKKSRWSQGHCFTRQHKFVAIWEAGSLKLNLSV